MNERHANAQLKKQNGKVNSRPVCPKSYSANSNQNTNNHQTQIPKYKSYPQRSANAGLKASKADAGEISELFNAGSNHPRYEVADCCALGAPEKEEAALSLELEIDESIKHLLRQGSLDRLGKNCNKSLDVTFVQQAASPEPVKTTVSFGIDEVSQLMDLVNSRGSKDTKHAKNDNVSGKRTADFELLDYYTSDDATEGSEGLYARGIVPPKTQTVYTSPQQTFNQIRTKLPCLKRSSTVVDDYDKPGGTPCLCQHCGMVGVLVESQKRPAIPHTPNPKFSGALPSMSSRNPKKIIDLRTKSKSETNLILLKQLATKIASLERRIDEQEEKTVKKDYFKFVIHKLLTQYSNKINELKSATYYPTKQNINIATQYSKKVIPQKDGYDRNDRLERHDRPEKNSNRYYPVRVNQKSSTEDVSAERYYRKINRTKVSQRTANTSSTRNEAAKLGAHVTTLKTLYMTNENSTCPFISTKNQPDSTQENLSAHAIKNLCNIVYNKYCDSAKQPHPAAKTREKDKIVPEKLLKSNGSNANQTSELIRMSLPDGAQPNSVPSGLAGSARNRKEAQYAKRMDVSPATETWQDESEQEFAVAKNTREHEQKRDQQHLQQSRNNSGHGSNANDDKNKTKHSVEDKIKYLKFLAKRKNVDESELWSNILNQAQKHIRSNDDTVSIQLPSLVNGPEMSELELTLSKLRGIVKKTCHQRKKDTAMDFSGSSSEQVNPFLQSKERKRNISPTINILDNNLSRKHFIAR